jgi:iron complex outermembrane receptor protein
MKMKRNPITNAVYKALMTGFVASSALGTVALAQQSSDEDQSVEEQGKITVTGSRISRVDVEGVTPVLTIDREDLENSGFKSVADVLRSNAFNSFGSIRESSGNTAQGQATISLRGIGSGRTLILVNGRRVPGSPVLDGQVQNLNTVPFAAVERIDILSDGASAVYGSDAIGGVINVILRSDYEGASLNIRYDDPVDAGAQSEGASVIFGGSTDRSSFTMSIEADSKDILFARDRDYLSNRFLGGDVDDVNNYSNLSFYARNYIDYVGGTYTAVPLIQGPPGSDVCSAYGAGFWPTVLADSQYPGDTLCGYDYTKVAAQTASLDRFSFFGTGEYKVNDNLTAFAQLISTRAESFGRYAPSAAPFWWTGETLPETDIVYNGQNYTLNELQQGQRVYYRFDITGGGRDTTQVDNQMDAQFGFQGYHYGVDWEVTYQYDLYDMQEWGDGYINQQGIALAALNGWDPRHPNQAGLYSNFVGQIKENANRRAQMKMQRFEFGGQFDIGMASMFVGGEYREEEYYDQTQAQAEAGLIGGSSGGSSSGERDAKALFTEVVMPVGDQLEFTGALRWDDYSDFGSNVSGKLGARFEVSDNLMFRATYGTGFRAPSLDELFQASAFSAAFGRDVVACDAAGIEFADCAVRQYDTYFLSNENLKPEESTQYLVGAVWDISDAVGFNMDMSLDYYYTEVEDLVTTLAGTGLFFADLLGLVDDLSALPGGDCYAVDRDPATGRYIQSTACGVNIGEFNTSGLDFRVNMSFELGNAGILSLRNQTNYVLDFEQVDYYTGPLVDIVGRRGVPEYRTNFDVNWVYGDHTVALSSYYIPSQSFSSVPNANLDFTDPSTFYNVPIGPDVDSYWNHNLSYTYSTPWNSRIQLGVTNLTNEDPVLDENNSTDDTLYPFKSRAYYISYTQDF